ncbi:diguanylate cyclase [Acetobacterium malicum]|uniref:Diguanylate cyclase n=2 Tax=Acetobacterium malicum TaxID=52692 RepID=A0ABR6YUU4_9FIRM|nr:diguanylate cyclase [Acetobacterium malicum]
MKMSRTEPYENSFVLLCDNKVMVKKVLSVTGIPAMIKEGHDFSAFLLADSVKDWEEIIANKAFGSNGFYLKGLVAKIQFISYSCLVSIVDDETILVIGIETENLVSFYEEMSRINSRLTNSVRQLYKDKLQNESSLYEEISRMNSELSNAKRELQKKNIEYTVLNDKLNELSVRDPLTGLFNRRYFYLQTPQIVARSKRSLIGICLVMIDVNGFKVVNDTLGHDEGDRVLQYLAECFETVVRKGQDTVFRLGGDEFLVILEQCNLQIAEVIMARLRREYRKADRGTSLAMGMIEIMPDEVYDDLTDYLKLADELMYKEKMEMKKVSAE